MNINDIDTSYWNNFLWPVAGTAGIPLTLSLIYFAIAFFIRDKENRKFYISIGLAFIIFMTIPLVIALTSMESQRVYAVKLKTQTEIKNYYGIDLTEHEVSELLESNGQELTDKIKETYNGIPKKVSIRDFGEKWYSSTIQIRRDHETYLVFLANGNDGKQYLWTNNNTSDRANWNKFDN